MITAIKITATASFQKEQTISDLSQFNFFFGTNGTGKTTITRIIADPTVYPSCLLTWKSGTELEPMVYNRDFVDRNFSQTPHLKGVFTLGQGQVDAEKKIAEKREQISTLSSDIRGLKIRLSGADGNGGKKKELSDLEENFKTTCWEQKKKHDTVFQSVFEGYRNSQENFKKKVLEEVARNDTTPAPTQQELEEKCKQVFSSNLASANSIIIPDTAALIAHASAAILKKHVIGKQDVDIAAMIDRLQNSDWVRQGKKYFEQSDGKCPFCQQATQESFAQSLSSYFDETYETDLQAIATLIGKYTADSQRYLDQLASIASSADAKFLDADSLKSCVDKLKPIIDLNHQRLSDKQKEPSGEQVLLSITEVVNEIKALLEKSNDKITENNKLVTNIAAEKARLKTRVWNFVINELQNELAKYQADKTALDKAIAGLTQHIQTQNHKSKEIEQEIEELEKQITSVTPTIDVINNMLSMFGFTEFTLAEADVANHYKLKRRDGTDAKETLSEGEKSFVTFLYFYHLLKGSHETTGLSKDRVVVIDDPVSSLDSDVLFVVSHLIKGLMEEVRGKLGQIKQMLIFTHNIYFHKEVTYNSSRKNNAMNEETFWLIRKTAQTSCVERQTKNPITTSYKLLWEEIKRTDHTNISIQNTLRRILENYFKILGGVDVNETIKKFPNEDRITCRSLISWVNDGSHFAGDDIFVSNTNTTVEKYLEIFKLIFEKMGHIAHYDMMYDEQLPQPNFT
ncbi:MAG: AAA family ATPase [Thermoguttaceae bacterium]